MALLLSQGVAEEYHYSAFGERLSSGTLSPWGFSSKRTDFETGFVYFGRRYYIPEFGRWSTADPLGYEAGSNLYAYVSNAPLNRVDLYGLFDVRREISDFIKDSSNWESPPIDYKQPAIGIIHGVGDFGLRTGANLGAIGWGLTQPFSACDRLARGRSFSEDWNSFRQSNEAFINAGNRWMQTVLRGDRQNYSYQLAHAASGVGMDVGMLAFGTGIIKSAQQVAVRGASFMKHAFKLPSQTVMQESFQLNRFHQAARNLSETGQNNIRILHPNSTGLGKKQGLGETSKSYQ